MTALNQQMKQVTFDHIPGDVYDDLFLRAQRAVPIKKYDLDIDSAQDAMIKLYEVAEKGKLYFDETKKKYFYLNTKDNLSPLTSWIGTAAYNRAMDILRKMRSEGTNIPISGDGAHETWVEQEILYIQLKERFDDLDTLIEELHAEAGFEDFITASYEQSISKAAEIISNQKPIKSVRVTDKNNEPMKNRLLAWYLEIELSTSFNCELKMTHQDLCHLLGVEISGGAVAYYKQKYKYMVLTSVRGALLEQFSHLGLEA